MAAMGLDNGVSLATKGSNECSFSLDRGAVGLKIAQRASLTPRMLRRPTYWHMSFRHSLRFPGFVAAHEALQSSVVPHPHVPPPAVPPALAGTGTQAGLGHAH